MYLWSARIPTPSAAPSSVFILGCYIQAVSQKWIKEPRRDRSQGL